MKINIQTGDITKFTGDVIVNAANPVMLGGGGVDGAIHRAAGEQLKELCKVVTADHEGVRCPVGQVRPTPAADLDADWVFHTVGPIWDQQNRGESRPGEDLGLPVIEVRSIQDAIDAVREYQRILRAKLRECYERCLILADAMGQKSIAFPAISTGVYGCPQKECAQVALETCRAYQDLDIEVTFLLFHPDEQELTTAFNTWKLAESAVFRATDVDEALSRLDDGEDDDE